MIILKAFKYKIYPTKQQQITTQFIDKYDIIAIEDLNVAEIIKNHKLAKSINDASFSEFYSILSYKAKWYGKEVIKINR